MSILNKLAAERQNKPLKLILSTDWYTDCDDVVALSLLCEAYKAGAAQLLCVCADSIMPYTAASVDAVLTARGCPEIPIGIDKNAKRPSERCRYQRVLAEHEHTRENDGCPDAVSLFRKTLASLDGKAEIMGIGFMQVISGLLKSAPDEFSPLDGISLVKEKVERLWLMAGKWDIDPGSEHNFNLDESAREAGSAVCDISPVPIVFLGHEVGVSVITGGEDAPCLLGEAMAAHGSHSGRCSWDPMLALLAVTGDVKAAGYKTVRGRATVDPQTGMNRFFADENGSHCFVVKTEADEYYADLINGIVYRCI